jgi:hypothetical protein
MRKVNNVENVKFIKKRKYPEEDFRKYERNKRIM